MDMKKYVLGMIAVILAISFSAFTTAKKAKATEGSYYWYPVKPNSSDIDHTALINPTSAKYTKSELDGLDLIPCPEHSGTDCMRGFDDVQTTDNDDTPEDFTQKEVQ
jgi:hypothetical protein